ncbi:MAG: hypothetical protein FJX93_06360 [Bacteroidetes bacterium]|nr:hypothetical protein [Bacteroidota bacterium]
MVAADAARVRELWATPEQVSAADVPMLASLVAEYPAAVPLWWLYVRAVQRAEAPQFSQVLQRCAAVSPNRSALMAWVEAPLLAVARVEPPKVPAPSVDVSLKAAEAPKVAEAPKTVEAPKAVEPPKAPKAVESVNRAATPAPVAAAQSLPEVNLDSLPEKVREQILRARALKAKLTQSAVEQPSGLPVASAPIAVAPTTPPPAARAASVVPPTSVAEQPATPKPPKAAKLAPQTAPPVEAASASNLSPFAQFVARLAEQSKPKSEDLIDQFLTANPRISPVSKDAPVAEVRPQPDAQVTGLVTETLARMYAEQGHIAKAIQAYEILKLRVPEKSMIFAARIEALRNT